MPETSINRTTTLLQSLLFICILCTAPLASADGMNIKWDQTVVEISPGAHTDEVEGRFTFTNKGPDPVTIQRINATCGCTAVETDEEDDGQYAPDEKGHIDFTISFSRTTGEIRKYIYVTLTDGDSSETAKLTVVIDAPQYVNVQPSILFWEQKTRTPPAKTAMVVVDAETPIHITRITRTYDTEDFTVEKRTVEKGRKYEISLQPKTATQRRRITLDLHTDFPSGDDPLIFGLSGSVIPGVRTKDKSSGGELTSWFTSFDPQTQTYMVIGFSILGGIAVALLIFGVTTKSEHPEKTQDETDIQ